MTKTLIKAVFNILFLAILAILLHRYASLEQIQLTIKQIPPVSFAAGVSMLVITYILRTHRFFQLLKGYPVSWSGILKVMLRHNAINNLLPFRLGELSFPVLLKKQENIDFQTSLKVLLTARLYDLLIMGGLAFILINFLLFRNNVAWLALELIIFILMVALLAWLTYQQKIAFLQRFKLYFIYLQQNFRQTSTTSLLIWAFKTTGQALLLAPMLQTHWNYALLAILIIEGTAILPVNGPLNFGSLEGATLAVLTPLGLQAKTVLAAILNLHLAIIMLAALGYLLSLFIPSPRHKEVSS
ncbi:MAG: lysylphosphatidylglycerol synthase domain-containing protein [Reinekea sp.]